MQQRYFQKEIPESGVLIFGQQFRFDILETSDPTLIAELDKCVARGVGGVIAITKEQYDEEQKKKLLLSSSASSNPPHRQELSALRLDARRVVEAVGNPAPRTGMFSKPQIPTDGGFVGRSNGAAIHPMPEPIEIPTPESFVVKPPPTVRLGSMK